MACDFLSHIVKDKGLIRTYCGGCPSICEMMDIDSNICKMVDDDSDNDMVENKINFWFGFAYYQAMIFVNLLIL